MGYKSSMNDIALEVDISKAIDIHAFFSYINIFLLSLFI